MDYVFLFAIGVGIVAGLRSLTAPAIVSWAAHFGWLNLHDSPLGFMGSTTAVAIFSLLAIGELVADKLPTTPNRTTPAPLLARIITGALCGACILAAAEKSVLAGAVVGAMAGVIGAFAGYKVRRSLVNNLHIHDVVVAVCEDLFAIWFGLFPRIALSVKLRANIRSGLILSHWRVFNVWPWRTLQKRPARPRCDRFSRRRSRNICASSRRDLAHG